jgi:phosphotransferase system IIB component
MPRLRSPDDRITAITRLRFVMEDPTQLLSNSVAHFVIDQLCERNNQTRFVVIPGFSNVSYPTRD